MARYRELILELILQSHMHPTAEEIYALLKPDNPTLALASVYNNLNTLSASGEIRRMSIDKAPDRYDRPTRHDHLICAECGALQDVVMNDLSEQLTAEIGTDILSYDLQIRYICPACRKTKHIQ